MAELKPCKTCSKDVSTEAMACPHCGQGSPVAVVDAAAPVADASPADLAKALGVMLLFGVLFWQCGSCGDDDPASAPAPRAAPATRPPWYEGGTLHKSDLATWRKAGALDKLATAGDWAVGGGAPLIAEKVKAAGSMDAAKPFASALVACIDTADADRNVPGEVGTAKVVAACFVSLGWLLPPAPEGRLIAGALTGDLAKLGAGPCERKKTDAGGDMCVITAAADAFPFLVRIEPLEEPLADSSAIGKLLVTYPGRIPDAHQGTAMRLMMSQALVADLEGDAQGPHWKKFADSLTTVGAHRFPSEHFGGKSTVDVEKFGEVMLMATVTAPR